MTYANSAVEWRALSALVENTDVIYKITDKLFTNDRIQVFDAIRKAHSTYGTVTSEGIERFLQRTCPQELFVPVGVNIEASVDELQRLAIKRQLKVKGERLLSIADKHEPNMDEVQEILEIEPIMTNEDSSLFVGTQQFLTELHHKIEKKYQFVSTGFERLDIFMKGEWKRQALTVIGGLPGTGKTALCLDSMLRMARNGISSLMINLEMPKRELIERLVSNIASIDNSDIGSGALKEDEQKKVEETVQYINKLPMYIIDKEWLSLSEILGYIKDHLKLGVKVVFIDHLKLIKWEGTSENDALGIIAQTLKLFAKKHSIAIILLSQLTQKDGGFHVRGSGEVEPIADVFMLMLCDSQNPIRDITIKFKKNRGGMTGETPLLYESMYLRFRNNPIGKE